MSRKAPFIVVVTILLGSPGCRLPVQETEGVSIRKTDLASIERTREALGHFANRYIINIQGAAARISQNAPDVETRRRVVLWQIFAAAQGRDAAFQHDIVAALIDMWILCVQMREFFENGDGRNLFGEETRFALDAARENEKDIDRVTVAILPETRGTEARDSVQKLASEHPIRFPFARDANVTHLQQADGGGELSWWYDKSLSPLRAIGGFDETAMALLKVAEVGRQTNLVATYLPDQMRLQSLLFLYEPDVQSALASMKAMSEGVDRISRTAETLPGEISRQIERSLEDLKKNDQFMKEILTLLTTFVADLQKASVDVGQAGDAWESTTKAIHAMVNDFRGVDEEGVASAEVAVQPAIAVDPADGPAPYDVNDYGKAAKEIARAAVELREATAEVKSLVQSDTPAVTAAAGELEGLVNRAALFGLLLIVAFFAGLIVYRVVAVRVSRGE